VTALGTVTEGALINQTHQPLMIKTKWIVALVTVVAASAWGQSVMFNGFTNNTAAAIPDGNPVGVTEQFAVSGLSGGISNVEVQLNISGGLNGDLYAYLVSPSGQMAVLLNRSGLSAGNPVGYADAGLDVTLDALTTNNIHYYQNGSYTTQNGQLTGTWAADGRKINPQSSGSLFDSTSPAFGLNIFLGPDATLLNGTWTLFVADLASGGGSPSLNQAVLGVTTVPEPAFAALVAMGAGAVWFLRRRLR
jgi:hypothetical protein